MTGDRVVLSEIDDATIYDLLSRADEIGLKLEMSETGFPWEAAPGQRHQEVVLSVMTSIRPPRSNPRPCECHRSNDVAIRFPDGLVKRPDISVFCKRPKEEEGLIHEIPEAAIEITSPGYEDKDLVLGPTIYLRNGVKDLIVLDRRTNEVHHWTLSGHATFASPHDFVLACGCQVTV